MHNVRILQSGESEEGLIPKYRKSQMNRENLICCPYCKGLYGKGYLADHLGRCVDRPLGDNKRVARKRGELLLPLPYDTSSSFYSNVIARMKKDAVFRYITNDSLLLILGERLYDKKDVEENTANVVSSRLRELGRLIQVIREESKMQVKNMHQAMEPHNFTLLLKCIRKLAGFDEDTHHFQKPSLALKLGHSLRKCSSIKASEALKRKDKLSEEDASAFDKLMTSDWNDRISSAAGQSVERNKFNKPKLLHL